MKRNVAIPLMDLLTALGEPLNRAAQLIEQIEDEEERKTFREGIGGIMAHIFTDLEFPIIRQYPELDPDKE
jgi:hypothetical protein